MKEVGVEEEEEVMEEAEAEVEDAAEVVAEDVVVDSIRIKCNAAMV